MGLIDILSIDFFSYKPNLTYAGKAQFKTRYGIISSYITIIFCIFAIFFFSEEIFLRKNPNLIITEVNYSTEDPAQIRINSDDLKLAFGMFESDRLIPYYKTYFNVTGQYYIIKLLDITGTLD